MSNYKLYGETLIENDSTLKDFAQSVCNGVPVGDIDEEEDFKDQFLDLVYTIIYDDISRTDIDYESLMYKYRGELGCLLYDLENNGLDIPKISFLGDEAEECFNYLLNRYINIHYDELAKESIK